MEDSNDGANYVRAWEEENEGRKGKNEKREMLCKQEVS